ncbi:hypothetical protein GCM10007962_22410 [Yeosuana aromativorans]|uniref:Restriction endonuclease type IV Mrr domain-containing protein n=1 Tax=Yeosuana aromativorans TaxID=288019 RepID=A0A8J3BQF3_9FLAO|nr:restriction endonuclease [Yeosuana aromativorans]GGK27672.1 hypothetical protein GCM10007962_22410 [Yeosuana aromativorans]
MDWKSYEEITRYIYEKLGEKSGVQVECFGNNCKVLGKSNVEHQVDVLTKHSDGIHTYKTAIECKYWEQKINKDIVMKVSEIIEDAGINKGVIVSKKGFTPDGISFAKYKNIGLVELREMEEKDWDGRPPIFEIKSELRRPEILGIMVHNTFRTNLEREKIEVDFVYIQTADRQKIPYSDFLKNFKKDLHKEQPNLKIEKYYPFIGADLINSKTKTKIAINGILCTGVLKTSNSGIKFYPVDGVWLIMKSLFEEKTFTISKQGLINEKRKP